MSSQLVSRSQVGATAYGPFLVDGGPMLELVPGDMVSFVKGAASTWTVVEPMKKFFVISS